VVRRHRWLRPVILYTTNQGVTQMLAFLTGVLVVRMTTKDQYAIYAIVNLLIAAAAMLTESGLSSVLLASGSRLRHSPSRLSSLFAGAIRFRYRWGSIVISVFVGILVAVLTVNRVNLGNIVPYAALLVLTVVPTLSKGIRQVYLRLESDVRGLQRVALQSALLRLALTLPLIVLSQVDLVVVLLINVVAAVFENWRIRSRSSALNVHAAFVPSDIQDFRWSLRKVLPMSMVIVLQDQLLFFLLGFRGNQEIIADIAALSRFALVFVILNAPVTDVASGIVARAASRVREIARLYALVLGMYITLVSVCIFFVYLFSGFLLSILGDAYSGLHTPLLIVVCGCGLINFANAFRSLNFARGWVAQSWLFIPTTAIWAICGVFLFDLRNSVDAALFMASQSIPALITQLCCMVLGLRALRRQTQRLDDTPVNHAEIAERGGLPHRPSAAAQDRTYIL
jgi:hypothetical protein